MTDISVKENNHTLIEVVEIQEFLQKATGNWQLK